MYKMSYEITSYTFNKAKELGVEVKPSKTGNYKLDVFNKKGDLISRVGDRRYGDFPTFVKQEGKTFADKRRKAYKVRHEKDRKEKGTRGYFADQLLW
jgi:hypothetical protein